MKLSYNNFALDGLGRVQVAQQTEEFFPENAPQHARRRIVVKIHTAQPNYADNYALIEQGRRAVRDSVHGTLVWKDDNGNDLLNRPVTVVSHNWPEANAWGTFHQELEIVFQCEEALSFSSHQGQDLRLTPPAPNSGTLVLGGVYSVKYLHAVNRFDPMIPHRNRTDARLEIKGIHQAPSNLAVPERRAYLLDLHRRLKAAAASGKELTLNYAGVAENLPVQVDDFNAEIDQANWSIPWELAARWVDFPNTSGYAQCQYTAQKREDKEAGTITLLLSGSVAANSEAAARTKWRAVRNTHIAPNQQQIYEAIRTESRVESIDGEDGAAFLKVQFDEEYRKAAAGVVSWDLKVKDDQDVPAGLTRRTYSGAVNAAGATYDAAYNAAVAKAKELGYGKNVFLKQGSLEATRNYRQPAEDGLPAKEWVTVAFSFEYQIKDGRIYVEVTSSTNLETWGDDTENVRGYITALDRTAIAAIYQELKRAFAGRLFAREQFDRSEQEIGNWDYANNRSLEGRTPMLLRWDFNWTITANKVNGRARYSMEVDNNYQQGERVTTIEGTVWAATGDVIAAQAGQTEDAATIYLNQFLEDLTKDLALGTKRQDRRRASHERAPSLSEAGQMTGTAVTRFTGLDFAVSWVAAITGAAAILESSLEEEITPSGDRQVVQATATGTVVIQTCGQTEGMRRVRGSVKATNEAMAIDWIRRQRALPRGDGISGSGFKGTPPVTRFAWKYADMADAPVRGQRPDSAKVLHVEASFEFTEYYETLTGITT